MIRLTQNLIRTLRSLSWSPYAQGRAAELAGKSLMADGVPRRYTPLGKTSHIGIFGSMLIFLAGVAMLFAHGMLKESTSPYPNGTVTSGVVTGAIPTSNMQEIRTCSLIVEYRVQGQRFTTQPGNETQSMCGMVGETVPVSYLAADPQHPRVLLDSGELQAFKIMALLLMVTGAALLVIRTVCVLIGHYLSGWGAQVASGAVPSDIRDAIKEIQNTWNRHSGSEPTNTEEHHIH